MLTDRWPEQKKKKKKRIRKAKTIDLHLHADLIMPKLRYPAHILRLTLDDAMQTTEIKVKYFICKPCCASETGVTHARRKMQISAYNISFHKPCMPRSKKKVNKISSHEVRRHEMFILAVVQLSNYLCHAGNN